MHPLRWLYIDMNSYFASCEQHLQAHLRGRPVGIVPSMAETTCCIAASYEAKKFGIKTGTLIKDAKQLCPDIEFVVARHRKYIELHHELYRVVETCIPIEKICSIDEYACRLTGSQQSPEKAQQIALQIKEQIRSQLGPSLSCSIGASTNRWLAKIAAEIQKPDGFHIIEAHEIQKKLSLLPLQDLPGVGRAMLKNLNQNKIFKTQDLLKLNSQQMNSLWGGVWGSRMYMWIKGEDLELAPSKTSSIGHEHVLEPKFRNHKDALLIAKKLINKAAYRLREANLLTQKISVSVRMQTKEKTYWESSVKIAASADSFLLIEKLNSLWTSFPKNSRPLRVSIQLSSLLRTSEKQLSLFEENNSKREQLSHIIDKVNQRYGKDSIYLGALSSFAEEEEHSPIAFNHIPNISKK